MANNINWTASKEDRRKIEAIVDRFLAVAGRDGYGAWGRRGLVMDLTGVHLNSMALNLDRLFASSEIDLLYDVTGISNHLNRDSYELERGFVPRCNRATCK